MVAGDGRITLDELDERLTALQTARVYEDLRLLLAGLPPERLPGAKADVEIHGTRTMITRRGDLGGARRLVVSCSRCWILLDLAASGRTGPHFKFIGTQHRTVVSIGHARFGEAR